ncbi:LLM class flavin-dependent oxidoreductase [Corynebacterium striatum]|uniref:LLM class flavin-dependent oxidoreductase n=1 Tax=Corynebacterium striatum TaxID=43770 RepID=UPI003AC0C78C
MASATGTWTGRRGPRAIQTQTLRISFTSKRGAWLQWWPCAFLFWTARIQVGSAGIMVPNHPPLIIAEQAAMLESLYPGRIIIGLGSSVGFTKPVREALRQTVEAKQRFDSDLAQVRNFLLGDAPITLRPHAGPPLFVLAGFRSALSAAKLGLGVILSGPVETQVEAARVYRENFQGTSPVVISSLNIAVAEDEAYARRLLLPEAYAQVLSQSAGVFGALDPDPDLKGLTGQQRERLEQALANTVYGTPAAVEAKLADIAEKLGVEEFLVTGDIPDREGRAHSEELLAGLDLFTRMHTPPKRRPNAEA